MLKNRRSIAHVTQRELEYLTRIDQTVLSRLENGKQYGLRWSRFAILVATLDGLDDATAKPPDPWWVRMGITPPPYMLDQLREQGLLPPEFDPKKRRPESRVDDEEAK
jgi:transcriptional regulator with XRE-family HTH domain